MNTITSRVIIIFFLLIAFLIILTSGENLLRSRSKSLTVIAAEVIKKCSSMGSRSACYDEEIPKLMDREHLSMEQSFEMVKIIQSNDDIYGYCHVVAHRIAERETTKDPVNWQNVLQRCPVNVCENGCIHGAFQARFQNEAIQNDQDFSILKSDLAKTCVSTSPDGRIIRNFSCYHGIGHLLMYATSADIHKSLATCDELTPLPDDARLRRTCYSGSLMQIFQPFEQEDKALVKKVAPANKNDVKAFCEYFTGEKRDVCWRESWPLFEADLGTPDGIVKFCSEHQGPGEVQTCFRAMIQHVILGLWPNHYAVQEFCAKFTPELEMQCHEEEDSLAQNH